MDREEPQAGQPLTDQPRHGGRLHRRADEVQVGLAALTESHHDLLKHLVGLESLSQAVHQLLIVPRQRVAWSGTAVIGPSGVWTKNLQVVTKAIFVMNFTGNGTLTVASQAPLGSAPGAGVGTHTLHAGGAAVFNDETNDWTLYGTPGNSVDVQIFGVPIQPMAAGSF